MFPMNPMMFMPFMGNVSQQPTAEQMAQRQRLALENQQLQLRQMQQMLEQYAQSIDAALKQIDEQFAKLDRGETVAFPAQIQIQPQAQALSQRLELDPKRFRTQILHDPLRDPLRDPLLYDPLRDPLRDPLVDPANWVISGMGDFGRPVF